MSSQPRRLSLFKNSVFNSVQEALQKMMQKGLFKVPESHDTNQPFSTQDQSVRKAASSKTA